MSASLLAAAADALERELHGDPDPARDYRAEGLRTLLAAQRTASIALARHLVSGGPTYPKLRELAQSLNAASGMVALAATRLDVELNGRSISEMTGASR